MGVLCDEQIRQRIQIDPFAEGAKREGVISYGLSSYGYDIRLDRDFRVFHNLSSGVIDPKNFDKSILYLAEGDSCIIPPNSFALGTSLERLCIPRDVLAICLNKSTLARCGLVVNISPIEPEWFGKITLEISNTTPLPARVYAGEGIAQIIFLEASQVCRTSYQDKKGKYQDQQVLTLPMVL